MQQNVNAKYTYEVFSLGRNHVYYFLGDFLLTCIKKFLDSVFSRATVFCECEPCRKGWDMGGGVGVGSPLYFLESSTCCVTMTHLTNQSPVSQPARQSARLACSQVRLLADKASLSCLITRRSLSKPGT